MFSGCAGALDTASVGEDQNLAVRNSHEITDGSEKECIYDECFNLWNKVRSWQLTVGSTFSFLFYYRKKSGEKNHLQSSV